MEIFTLSKFYTIMLVPSIERDQNSVVDLLRQLNAMGVICELIKNIFSELQEFLTINNNPKP